MLGRGAEGCCGTGSEQPEVGCSLSSLWYQALLLQSYHVVVCVLAPGSLHRLGQVTRQRGMEEPGGRC